MNNHRQANELVSHAHWTLLFTSKWKYIEIWYVHKTMHQKHSTNCLQIERKKIIIQRVPILCGTINSIQFMFLLCFSGVVCCFIDVMKIHSLQVMNVLRSIFTDKTLNVEKRWMCRYDCFWMSGRAEEKEWFGCMPWDFMAVYKCTQESSRDTLSSYGNSWNNLIHLKG